MPSTKAIKVLYCCSESNKDENLRQQLETHLSLLERQGYITSWHKGMIGAGKEWQSEIDRQLNTGDLILLLVSSDFIASPYNWNIVMKQAMQRHKARQARAIPVLFRPVDNWKSGFGNLKALPKDERPVTKWRNYDHAFESIAQGIREEVEELRVSAFSIDNFLRQIGTGIIPVAKAFVNMVIAVAVATFYSRELRFSRRNRASMMPVGKVVVIVVGSILLITQLPNLLRIISFRPNPTQISTQNVSSRPNLTPRSTQNATAIGWFRLGIVNNNSRRLSIGDQLLQSSDLRSDPSIDSPVVPSIGAVVTVKNPVNLRENRPQTYNSDLPEKVRLLKPKEKLIILQLQGLVNPDSNSSRIEIWAQVSKCQRSGDK